MATPRRSLTTKELSRRTWSDFERLFSQGNGWDHCWCMGYQGGNKSGARRAERGAVNRADKQGLVQHGRSHGILVYTGNEPVGWCQFGPANELPVKNERSGSKLFDDGEERKWMITCFVTHKDWRDKGVARTALRAALQAIRRKGGGLVEAYPFPRTSEAPTNPELARELADLVSRHGRSSPQVKSAWIRREGGVTYEGGKALLVEEIVEGVGPVNALCRWWAPAFHVGTVAMFEREGFRAIATVPPSSRSRKLARTGADDVRRFEVTRVVMQKTI